MCRGIITYIYGGPNSANGKKFAHNFHPIVLCQSMYEKVSQPCTGYGRYNSEQFAVNSGSNNEIYKHFNIYFTTG